MHVLLDCRMATWSGVGRYTGGLARALARRDDVRLTQVCVPGETAPVSPGPTVDVAPARAHPFSPLGAFELGRVARAVRPDLIHCTHFPTPVRPCAPLVVTLHDLTPLVVPGVMPSSLRRLVYRRWNSRAARLADRVITPSHSTADDVSRLLPPARMKLRVTCEAADDFSSGAKAPLAGRLAELASEPYVLSMGNTKPHKDLPTLLGAFGRVAPARSDLRLLLAGAEPSGYLQAQMPDMPVDVRSRVVFSGQLDDAELRTLYAGASVFVFPSRYEGFGLPVLEAMTLGAPVLCADAASLPEVAGDAALYFPAGDPAALAEALGRMLDDPALRSRLVEAGHDRAAGFSWDRTAEATVAVYTEAIAPRGRRGRDTGETQGGGAS